LRETDKEEKDREEKTIHEGYIPLSHIQLWATQLNPAGKTQEPQ
jgi:hypothetical protein